MPNSLEILAPVGSRSMLSAAVFAGADSVYLGMRGHNARTGAENFDAEGLLQATAFCHARSCRVYVTLNTLMLPGEEPQIEKAVEHIAQAGCDAVIVQDFAVASIVKKRAPQLEIHASTQMSVHSLAGVQKLAQWGFSRAILARELHEEEIAAIAAKSPIALEVFVHGAMCVSVSGQCYLSTFLGGRSANRGCCAGPCRLPFYAQRSEGEPKAPKGTAQQQAHHLSLKDLSILDALPRLRDMGVASAKIEGRLRGPEYCAVVVDAAKKALSAEPYDKQLVSDIFGRSGLGGGWFSKTQGAEMFGARTQEDGAATRKAMPKARELYRREAPRVAVSMSLRISPQSAQLMVEDGTNSVSKSLTGSFSEALQDNGEALCDTLQKTGGTPFYLKSAPDIKTNGLYIAGGEVAKLRRDALNDLLALREQKGSAQNADVCKAQKQAAQDVLHEQRKVDIKNPFVPAERNTKTPHGMPLLRARFESVAQIPQCANELCRYIILPIEHAEDLPPELCAKTILQLPRMLFGEREAQVRAQVKATSRMGFAGYEVQNLAHLKLCEGLPMSGGFGLNVTNAISAKAFEEMGCGVLCLSAELSLKQMRSIALEPQLANVATDAICYGHFPLMITRACPLTQLPKVQKCDNIGTLTGKKGGSLLLGCARDVRSVYNPHVLWMAESLHKWPCDYATLYFTNESRRRAQEVLEDFACAKPASVPFTRGMYERGLTQGGKDVK